MWTQPAMSPWQQLQGYLFAEHKLSRCYLLVLKGARDAVFKTFELCVAEKKLAGKEWDIAGVVSATQSLARVSRTVERVKHWNHAETVKQLIARKNIVKIVFCWKTVFLTKLKRFPQFLLAFAHFFILEKMTKTSKCLILSVLKLKALLCHFKT